MPIPGQEADINSPPRGLNHQPVNRLRPRKDQSAFMNPIDAKYAKRELTK
jgi:hypothetical protein